MPILRQPNRHNRGGRESHSTFPFPRKTSETRKATMACHRVHQQWRLLSFYRKSKLMCLIRTIRRNRREASLAHNRYPLSSLYNHEPLTTSARINASIRDDTGLNYLPPLKDGISNICYCKSYMLQQFLYLSRINFFSLAHNCILTFNIKHILIFRPIY